MIHYLNVLPLHRGSRFTDELFKELPEPPHLLFHGGPGDLAHDLDANDGLGDLDDAIIDSCDRDDCDDDLLNPQHPLLHCRPGEDDQHGDLEDYLEDDSDDDSDDDEHDDNLEGRPSRFSYS